MPVIIAQPLPEKSFLSAYRERKAYTDAYSLELPFEVTLAEYIEAFYTTWLFKLERVVLATLVARPSSERQAAELALGDGRRFAAWTVEARETDQILMCDFLCKTRSWLMCDGKRLWFGSAIVPKAVHSNGEAYLGIGFHLLIPLHRLYSKALLRAAARKLIRSHES
ncbi:hypothetical protein ABI_01800 [Asticcacaulis biprosthecium C19]|uniref:DUF2867 domain-containing protein n=1 Tax=Asticcacaulis biprosthecium C19 TaxID=715226 RepID=F4QIB2_9CAUL|nr:hypothetical protein [Asticcacaulis biprosthecium]EGF91750.1 hypothetical protein ABI_01800 [Asticcacaulis biprosthecium C19]